jgi:hypothetical protein
VTVFPRRPRPANRDDPVKFTGEVWDESEGAYFFFVRFGEGAQAVWLFKNYAKWNPDNHTMTMPRWYALDKELI